MESSDTPSPSSFNIFPDGKWQNYNVDEGRLKVLYNYYKIEDHMTKVFIEYPMDRIEWVDVWGGKWTIDVTIKAIDVRTFISVLFKDEDGKRVEVKVSVQDKSQDVSTATSMFTDFDAKQWNVAGHKRENIQCHAAVTDATLSVKERNNNLPYFLAVAYGIYVKVVDHFYAKTTAGGKGATKKRRTSDRYIDGNGRSRVVFVGPRGGRYIMSGGKYVRISIDR